MASPQEFYTSEIRVYKNELKAVKRYLFKLSMFRLLVFLSIGFTTWFFFGNSYVLIPVWVIGIALFLYLVSIYTDGKLNQRKLEKLIEINELEIAVLQEDFSGLETGEEFRNPNHEYSYDIDLFGKGSFFQFLNRTSLKNGKQYLASVLEDNNPNQIIEKQEAIKELAQKPKWRQHYLAIGSLIQVDEPIETLLHWLRQHKVFTPSIMRILPSVFTGLSLVVLVLYYVNFVSNYGLLLWFMIGLSITGFYLKKINHLYLYANKAKDTFKQYHQLLERIEQETFQASLLKHKQKEIETESKKASQLFLEFSKTLDAFDQRNNMIIGIFANGFALRDLHHCYKIEQWMQEHLEKVESWFSFIAFFDAQISLANFAFNHESNSYPKLNKENKGIKAQDLGHPLLNKSKRITSSLYIDEKEFFIVTGANMAGKSTFLRTMSLAIMMANTGLPVCAKEFNYSPIKLITSMRTSDSLSDDESYFFSELKRLKFIVEKLKTDTYFIILDEILKGTNSTDKANGSKKFVKKLVDYQATGIIATHDLSLCEIAKEESRVQNYYFDAEITNDELYFDYTLKKGICKNMNASFLLKKMDIV